MALQTGNRDNKLFLKKSKSQFMKKIETKYDLWIVEKDFFKKFQLISW